MPLLTQSGHSQPLHGARLGRYTVARFEAPRLHNPYQWRNRWVAAGGAHTAARVARYRVSRSPNARGGGSPAARISTGLERDRLRRRRERNNRIRMG
jgi:hypothetical protein